LRRNIPTRAASSLALKRQNCYTTMPRLFSIGFATATPKTLPPSTTTKGFTGTGAVVLRDSPSIRFLVCGEPIGGPTTLRSRHAAPKMNTQADSPGRENKPPSPLCVACGNPMAFIVTIADPLVKRVRLFECPQCRNTAFIKEIEGPASSGLF
jgi:hypothetical protein